MRYFPRAGRSRHAAYAAIAVLGLLSLLLTSLLPVLQVPRASAQDDLDQRHDEIKTQLAEAEQHLDGSSKQAQRAAAELADAEAELSAARSRLADARARLAEAKQRDEAMKLRLHRAQARLTEAQAELAEAQAQLEAQRTHVRTLVTDIYTQGDPQLLALAGLFHARTPADLTRQMELRNGVVSAETNTLRDFNTLEIALRVRENAVSQATAKVAGLRKAAARNLVRVKALEAEAEQAAASVSGLVERRSKAHAQAVKAKKADAALVAELKAEDARVRELLRQRAEEARQQQEQAASGSGDGYLSYPAGGRITSPYGYRHHPIYGYWGLHNGIDFAPGCGAPLRAPADGTVVARYWNTVYGYRLIIDHGLVAGHGLATILNHATTYTVSPGERVKRGEVVGYVGSTGWSTGCHLHFTVMEDGNPVDPMTWL